MYPPSAMQFSCTAAGRPIRFCLFPALAQLFCPGLQDDNGGHENMDVELGGSGKTWRTSVGHDKVQPRYGYRLHVRNVYLP